MDTIRDMLSVGQVEAGYYVGDWALYWWGQHPGTPNRIAHSPREEEMWGIASLILEYVEAFGYDPGYGIACALHDYQLARAGITPLDSAPAPDEMAYQDHAHLMGYVG